MYRQTKTDMTDKDRYDRASDRNQQTDTGRGRQKHGRWKEMIRQIHTYWRKYRLKRRKIERTHKEWNWDFGRVSSERQKRVCSRETRWQYEHIFKNFNCPTREWAKWVSEPVNGASKHSEHSEVERCGASERTNVASDRVALSKRDRLWLETPPYSCFVLKAPFGTLG